MMTISMYDESIRWIVLYFSLGISFFDGEILTSDWVDIKKEIFIFGALMDSYVDAVSFKRIRGVTLILFL